MINASGTIFIRHNGDSTAIDIDASTTVTQLKQEVQNALSAKGIIAPKAELFHGTQDVSKENDDMQLSELGICSESMIDVNDNIQLIKLNVSLERGHYYSLDYMDRLFAQKWTERTGEDRKLYHEFQITTGSNTFFRDLQSQIIGFIKQEFNHTIPESVGVTISVRRDNGDDGSDDFDHQCPRIRALRPVNPIFLRYPQPRASLFGIKRTRVDLILQTSDDYSRLETDNQVPEYLALHEESDTVASTHQYGSWRNITYYKIDQFATFNGIHHFFKRTKNQNAICHFYKDYDEYKNYHFLGNLCDKRLTATIKLPDDLDIIFPHSPTTRKETNALKPKKQQPKGKPCVIM